MSETDRELLKRGGTGPLRGEGVSQAKGGGDRVGI